MLGVVIFFFSILLIIGIIKSYKIKKENEHLDTIIKKYTDSIEKPYEDFTDGHMYDRD